MTEYHVDHEARRRYLIDKLTKDPKCAIVVHMILDALHTVGTEGIRTIVTETGPIVIVDSRQKTRDLLT